ncbi:hypothetical protein, conserved [Babesia ovata]|uniref:C3H1-type domain-containing protein n=1 Tax=Babesia ovata TaxID=189622 RepID=A0A2H6KJ65_9APIC|nr:uncharacterized protein BOVATA_045300 [Babesia ovata]GBE63037.1 hypothetical protein, conserved [Babesia ovata]
MCHFTSFNYPLTFSPTFFSHLNCLGHYSFDNSPKSHCQSLDAKIAEAKKSLKSETPQSPNYSSLNAQIKQHEASKKECEKYHSLSESDRTAQLKDIRSRMVSLADLSVKLGQFIGKNEAVTDAINNAINTIINSDDDFKSLKNSPSSTVQSAPAVSAELIDVEKLKEKIQHYEKEIASLESKKSAQNPPLSSEESRLLSSYESKMDALQKLKSLNDSLNSLGKQSDDACKNLLTNLCSGLEKFLGYQETSKGYDGTGIVYSDLDRLCDGVMSFLHGVLETVKNDDNVTTYDKDNKIKNLPSKISKLMHNGSHGFSQAITQVSAALQAWSGELEKRTGEVTSLLSSLSSDIQSHKLTIDGTKNDSISLQHSTWMAAASKYFTYANTANNALSNLDTNLKNKLETPVGKIHSVVRLIHESATNLELDQQVRKVDYEMLTKKQKVLSEIQEKSEELQNNFTKHLHSIRSQINEIEKKRTEDLASLMKLVAALKEAVTMADEAAQKLGTEYQSKIVDKLKAIHDQTEGLNTDNIASGLSSVVATVSPLLVTLKGKLEEIAQAAQDVKNNVQNNLQYFRQNGDSGLNVGNEIKKLKDELNRKLKTYVTTYVEKVRSSLESIRKGMMMVEATRGTNSQLHAQASEAKNNIDALDKQLNKGAGNIGTAISGAVQAADGALGQVVSGVKEDLSSRVQGHIQDKIKEIDKAIQNNFGGGYGAAYKDALIQAKQKAIDAVASAIQEIKSSKFEKLFSDLEKQIQGAGGTGDTAKEKIKKIETKVGEYFNNGVGNTSEFKFDHKTAFGEYKSKKDEAATAISGVISDIAKMEGAYRDVDGLDSHLGMALSGPTSDYASDTLKLQDSVARRVNENVEATNTQLEALLKATADKGVDMLNAKVNGIINRELNTVHPTIETQINRLNKDLGTQPNNIYQAVKDLQERIERLKTLVSTVNKDAGNKIQQQVTSVKEQLSQIKQNVIEINEKTTKFDEALSGTIETAQSTVNSASEDLRAQITNLNETLTETAREAFDTIKNEVQTMMSNRHKAELENLRNLLEKQKEAVTKLIDADKISGLKGLFADMKKQMEDKIKKALNDEGNIKEEYRNVSALSICLNRFFTNLMDYIKGQVKEHSGLTSDVRSISLLCHTLFDELYASKHIDHICSRNLENLKGKLSTFVPKSFVNYRHPKLAGVLKNGMQRFVDELQKQYVNKYEGCQPITQWVTQDNDQSADQGAKQSADLTDDQKEKLTVEGRKGASVCLTVLKTLFHDLDELRDRCTKDGPCDKKRIYLYEPAPKNMKRDDNQLGHWFQRRGYGVSKEKNGHEGHLRNEDNFTGQNIHTLIEEQNIVRRPFTDDDALSHGIIVRLHDYISTYYQLCHITLHDSPKYPCSVRDMLSWMSGLPYRAVYTQIPAHCKRLLNDEDKSTGKFPNREDAVLSKTLAYGLVDNLSHTCRKSLDVLVTICGNGRGFEQADYPYTCNFMDNSRGFHYPENVPGLFDMLTDVCRRLLRSLNHLRTRCLYGASTGNGWAECSYGRDVSGYQWNCNTNQCPNQTCPQKHNQSAKQTPNQKCNQHPKCGVKSPLQSHLMDQLPGCLPHKLVSVGCSSQCSTCPKTSAGQQCLTPMGFWDLPNSASKMRSGKELSDMLAYFCKDADSPLCALLHCLQCVKPSPPTTLADMFALYCQLSRSWRPSGYIDDSSFTNLLSTQTITNSFPLKEWFHGDFTNADVTAALIQLYHSDNDHKSASAKGADTTTVTHSDLASLTGRSMCMNSLTCAPYLRPVCLNAYHTYPKKHAKLYLSWFTYLAWRFWKLLQELLDAFQQISCKNNGCVNCACRAGKHGEDGACKCMSVVHCGSVLSTMYRYGFTFAQTKKLIENQKEKSCSHFRTQLEKVVTSAHFTKLFRSIDEFMCAIRWPFMNTLLALWSLSLLYLLHVSVVRLDVLRIRSHLRSPASHRIAAQSLLAAARVRALANVKGETLDDIDARRISLGQLAGQLSGFIGSGQEVKDAILNGLHSNVSQLEKLLETSCEDKGCCKEAGEAIKKLNEVNESLKKHLKVEQKTSKNLAKILSKCKLNGPNDPLNKLNKEITEKIQKLEKEIESLKNDNYDDNKSKNASEIDKLNKDLQSHNASLNSLETLKELCGYAEKINQNHVDEQSCKNFLESLCTGLEKFLGYQNGNYTGEGIVYSDLDRLCDGVMSFLHGVLGNIKPKLGQHKDTLNSALNSLKSTNLNGIAKYRAAIAAVAEGVHEYNERVAASNESVSDVITALRDSVDDKFVRTVDAVLQERRDARGNIIDHAERDVTNAERLINDKLQQCQQNATTFITNLDVSDTSRSPHKESITDLNANLKDKLESVRRTVAYESERLGEVKGQEGKVFEASKVEIKRVLEAMKCSVDKSVSADITRILGELRERVQKILEALKQVSKNLGQYVIELESWIGDTQKFIDGIKNKGLDNILNEVNDSLTSKKLDIKDAVDKDLKNWKGKLEGYIQQLTQLTGEVDAKVTALASKFPKNAGVSNNLNEIFTEIQSKVGVIKHGVLEGPVSINQYWSSIKTDVPNFMDGLYKEVKSIGKSGHLYQVEEKTKQYVALFKDGVNNGLEVVVTNWIKEILDANIVAKVWINGYFAVLNKNRQYVTFKPKYDAWQDGDNTDKTAGLAEAIKNKLKSELGVEMINAKVVLTRGDAVESVQANVDAVYNCINGFAEALRTKLDSHKYTPFRQQIEQTIEQEVTMHLTHTSNIPDLTAAADAILSALHGMASQVAQQFKSLTGASQSPNLGKHLDDAIGKVKHFRTQFDNPRVQIDANLQRLEEPITYLSGNLQNALQDPTQTNHAANLDQAITDVKDRVAEVAANAIPQKLDDAAQKIKQHLETLADAVSRTTNDVRLKLAELQNEKIGNASRTGDVKANTLQDLRRKLNELHKSLESDPIKNADEFIKYVTAAETHYISELKSHTKKAAEDACNKLTTHARRQYVEALKFALQQFADKVTGELEELPGMIDNDKHIGLKGFMEAFYGNDSGDNINKLNNHSDLRTVCHSFEKFLGPLNTYISREIDRVKEEEHKKNPSLQKPQDPYSKQLNKVYSSLSTLITHIYTKNKYDSNLPTKLAELTATVVDLKLDGFPNPVTEMLGGISGGCRELVDVLGNVYISRYDGAAPVTWEGKKAGEISQEGKNCGKVFLSCVTVFVDELHHLFFNGGKTWASLKIDGSGSGKDRSHLKRYLMEEGFEIKNLVTKENTGKDVALRLSRGFTRYKTFNKDPNELESVLECFKYFKQNGGLLSRLFDHLHDYYNVCHLPSSSTKTPTTVHQMLTWLTGLPHNPVYHKLAFDGFSGLFEKSEKASTNNTDVDGITFEEEDADSLPAYPHNITAAALADILTEVCSQAETVLIAIQGHGHADGVYTCDHSNNTLNLAYPSSAGACLGMLADILRRLFYQLYFLYTQCSHNTDYSGWYNCSYGQGVGNSGWQCNDNLCPNQQCNLRPDQSTSQKCKQHPKCGVKSPLQSYLEDSLPGFLPHSFSNVGCGVKCSVGNHHGKPCLTPMGFNDISIKASHTKKGMYLQKVLEKFCGKAESPLTKLCSQLNCLSPTAPKTLGDMFSFYHNFLNEWNTKTEHKRDAFAAAVNKANFEKRYKNFDPAIMFGSPKHSHKQMNADLGSLVCNSRTTQTCGPYLQSINHDVIGTFSKNHAAKYLSWIVYATETFYDLLKKLYDDCCGTCGGDYPKCRVARGQHTCNAANQQGSDNDSDTCTSIVRCQHTRPTLYKYGFVHNDVVSLAGKKSKKSCKDFCDALKKVLNKEEKIGATLAELIYKTIPEFLFKIREPFIWTLLALWSLSLLYLLHITVVRLDVLRIRSHLRSPASHRIAAQSLLAAARVRALANVKYFSP